MSSATHTRQMREEVAAFFQASGFGSDSRRLDSLQAFLAAGFPSSKHEEYRFTPVTAILEKEIQWQSPAPADLPAHISAESPNCLVFLNGRHVPLLSKLSDTSINIHEAGNTWQPGTDPFEQLNGALFEKSYVIEVADDSNPAPIQIVHYYAHASGTALHPRWEFRLGRNSVATVMEETRGEARGFINPCSSVSVATRASLTWITIQQQADEFSVNNRTLQLADAAKANCYTVTLEGRLVRNHIQMVLDGEGIEAHLYGLYLIGGSTIVDNHTAVDHRKPNSMSNELYKGVIGSAARGVFNGKIFVRPHAQKTNAYQTNRNILLGDQATIHTKPQLEIWADDVKCSHGCTTGQLDEEATFYLRSRGIPLTIARAMMLHAFATETVATLTGPIRQHVDEWIAAKISTLA